MLSGLEASTCNRPESNMASVGFIGFRRCKNNIRIEYTIPKLYNRPIIHISMIFSSKVNESLESNMTSGGYIGFETF